MRVFKRDSDKSFHLVTDTRWAKDDESSQLVTYMVQKFCDDRAWPIAKGTKFFIGEYSRDEHGNKMCEACKLKAQKSKRYGPKLQS